MKLSRYNEVVIAIVGTSFLLGAVVLAGFLAVMARSPEPSGVIVKNDNTKPVVQNLIFCPPETEASGKFQYIPVGIVVADDSKKDAVLQSPKLSSYDSAGFSNCTISEYVGANRVFNVIVRNLATNAQTLLLKGPSQVVSVSLPSDKCSAGEGGTPCGHLLWKIRSEDTNHDGRINYSDALVAYESDLSGVSLKALTPPNATVITSQWIPKANKLQFQIRRDRNNDGYFTDEDGSELLETDANSPSSATAFVNSSIMDNLNKFTK
ncbi:MAG: hypothetical protein V4607_14740 [Pseudomonadota bacterium]